MQVSDRSGSTTIGRPNAKICGALALLLICGCQQTPGHQKSPRSFFDTGSMRTKVTPDQAADVQFALARSLESHGDLDPAIDLYRQALKQGPERVDAMVRLAVLYDRKGDFAASAPLYEKALQTRPKDPDLLCDRGYSFYLQGRWKESEKLLRQALANNPDHARSHNNLGLLLGRTGHPNEAMVEFSKSGIAAVDAHLNLGFALALERRWSEARAQYQLALSADPSSSLALAGLHNVEVLAQTDLPTLPAKRDNGVMNTSATVQTPSAGSAPLSVKNSKPGTGLFRALSGAGDKPQASP
jgi:Tfp pilus assembly protein PilF